MRSPAGTRQCHHYRNSAHASRIHDATDRRQDHMGTTIPSRIEVPSRCSLQPHQKKRTLDNASKFSNHGNQHSKARRFIEMVEMSVEERPLPVPGSFWGQRDRQRANPVPAKPLHCLREVERAWKLCRLPCVEELALLSFTR